MAYFLVDLNLNVSDIFVRQDFQTLLLDQTFQTLLLDQTFQTFFQTFYQSALVELADADGNAGGVDEKNGMTE